MPTVAETAWPAARPDRGDPIPGSTPPPTAPLIGGGQNTMIWPFFIVRTNGVAVAVSPAISGPAIIQEIAFQHNLAGGAVVPTWTLIASDSGGDAGAAFPASFIPGGDRLFENVSIVTDAANTATDNLGVVGTTLLSSVGFWRFPLNKIVRKSSFFLKLRINASSTNQFFLNGLVRLVQSVPENLLANFL